MDLYRHDWIDAAPLGTQPYFLNTLLDQVKVDVDAIKATLDQVNLVELRQEVNDMKKRLEKAGL